jgi:hypothetical protein
MADNNIDKVIKALNKGVLGSVERAVKKGTTEVAIATTAEMKKQIRGKRPSVKVGKTKVYERGHPPEAPMNRTGNLRRNIKYKVEKQGFGGSYVATIAPYAIYARRLEFGGGNWPAGTRYPFVEPTAKLMRANNRARNLYVMAMRYELRK